MVSGAFDWEVETDVALNILKNYFIFFDLSLLLFLQLYLKHHIFVR